jgi:type IV pilus assembly protein PilZ
MSQPIRRPSFSFESPVRSGIRSAVRKPREGERREIALDVLFQTDDGELTRGVSRDIGIGGMFIKTSSPAAYGTSLKLSVTLPTRATTLELVATVRWMSDEGMGVQFGLMGARETYEITKLIAGE